jgi:hypothetical protein
MKMNADQSRRYRLYIDESGDHTCNLLDDYSHRYLGLLGVWFHHGEDYIHFSENLDRFKKRYFGSRPDKPIILHRSEIINRKGPFGILCDHDVHQKFNEDLLGQIHEAQFRMVCVVIDKRKHLARYASPFHPYHYCLTAILERYCAWLQFMNGVGDVLAESRGRTEDFQLRQAYRRVYESGTFYFNHEHFQRTLTSKEIKIQPKVANIAGLQLADVLAHPIKQGMMIKRDLVKDSDTVFGKSLRKVTEGKLLCSNENQEIDGYGLVWL